MEKTTAHLVDSAFSACFLFQPEKLPYCPDLRLIDVVLQAVGVMLS